MQLAIERALTYEKCLLELEGMAKRACQYDKALANVGALFSQQVAGRVSTEVDPLVAYDTEGIVTRAKHLMTLYEELGIKRDRVIIRIPATWEGIQAAGQLEAQGINTHLILVYRYCCIHQAARSVCHDLRTALCRAQLQRRRACLSSSPTSAASTTGTAATLA